MMAGRGDDHHAPWEVGPGGSGKTARMHSLFLLVNRWRRVEAVPGCSAGWSHSCLLVQRPPATPMAPVPVLPSAFPRSGAWVPCEPLLPSAPPGGDTGALHRTLVLLLGLTLIGFPKETLMEGPFSPKWPRVAWGSLGWVLLPLGLHPGIPECASVSPQTLQS